MEVKEQRSARVSLRDGADGTVEQNLGPTYRNRIVGSAGGTGRPNTAKSSIDSRPMLQIWRVSGRNCLAVTTWTDRSMRLPLISIKVVQFALLALRAATKSSAVADGLAMCGM